MPVRADHPARLPTRWIRTELGSALHRMTCDRAYDAPQTYTLSRREAAAWLAAGDRRFLCQVCCPPDPRLAVVR